jgi:hypothetical protein
MDCLIRERLIASARLTRREEGEVGIGKILFNDLGEVKAAKSGFSIWGILISEVETAFERLPHDLASVTSEMDRTI